MMVESVETKNRKDATSGSTPIRLAILQRVCPGYRTALFKGLSSSPKLQTMLFIGEDVPNSKVKSTPNLAGINFRKLKTSFLHIGHRAFTWHHGLVKELNDYNPEVILCEGESHFIGYLQAIWYKKFYNNKVGLIHWCFTSLPGEPLQKPGVGTKVKTFFRKYFDAHLLYSTYSKKCLTELNVDPGKAFVATNVCDVEKFKKIADLLPETRVEARKKLGLPDKFTVLYTGTLDPNKKPDMMLDVAAMLDPSKFNFVLLGSGPLLEALRQRAKSEGLSNVFLPGRIDDELYLYYRASDTLMIPGRGGIVISEAMCFGLPVVVHQADGTEYDLVRNNETGIHLKKGEKADFKEALQLLQSNPGLCDKMNMNSREMVDKYYTTDNMIRQIIAAAQFCKETQNAVT
jgi:glycosyltransferase involved in cell wall biosynthesis